MKNLKLLFLSLDWYRTKDPKTPLAMASIQAAFNADMPSGVNSKFISRDMASPSFSIEETLQLIDVEQPSIFALGVYIWNENETQRILRHIQTNHPKCRVILGGPQITFSDHNLPLEYPGCNWFVKGAGELPFSKLIHWISDLTINNRTHQELKKLGIYHSSTLQLEKCDTIFRSSIAELPSPYLSRVVPLSTDQPFIRWETLRGCPYRCSFCQFKVDSLKPDPFALSRINSELKLFHDLKVKEIAVLDPIFNFNPSHYLPIIRKIQSLDMETAFSFQARLELLTRSGGEEFLAFCRDQGKVKLEFGVQTFNHLESGEIKRNNHLGQIEKGIALLHQYEIDFDLHLIFGLPLQTKTSFLESFRQACAAKPNRIFVYPLNILKGTGIATKAQTQGYSWSKSDYNILTSSKWMLPSEVMELKAFSKEINLYSKGIGYGEAGEWKGLWKEAS